MKFIIDENGILVPAADEERGRKEFPLVKPLIKTVIIASAIGLACWLLLHFFSLYGLPFLQSFDALSTVQEAFTNSAKAKGF